MFLTAKAAKLAKKIKREFILSFSSGALGVLGG